MRLSVLISLAMSLRLLLGCGAESEMNLLPERQSAVPGDAGDENDSAVGDEPSTDAVEDTTQEPLELCANQTCAAPTPLCDPATGACVACLTSTQCDGDLGYCEPASHTCVECLVPSDCTDQEETCDPWVHRCAEECAGDGDCDLSEAAHCDLSRGACVQCLEQSHCAVGESKTCLLPEGLCVECTDGSQCASGICDPVELECTEQ